MGRNRNTSPRHRVRQELQRAADRLEFVFEHINRSREMYGTDAPDHAARAELMLDLTAALAAALSQLRDDT